MNTVTFIILVISVTFRLHLCTQRVDVTCCYRCHT